MLIDQNTLIKIRNYGALKYTSDRIIVLLGLDPEEARRFNEEFRDELSQVRRFYEQGVAIGEYNIDVELAKQGEKGDVFAIMEINKQHENRRIDQLRNELFGV